MSDITSIIGVLFGCWTAGWSFGLLFRSTKQVVESIT